MMYGMYSKLPVEHVIAFLMSTHKRLGSNKFCMYLTLMRYDEFLLQLILEMTSWNSSICNRYSKFPALRKLMGDASL